MAEARASLVQGKLQQYAKLISKRTERKMSERKDATKNSIGEPSSTYSIKSVAESVEKTLNHSKKPHLLDYYKFVDQTF